MHILLVVCYYSLSSTLSYWIFTISVTDVERLLPYELLYDVNGRGVNILNCGIRSTQFIAQRSRYHIGDIVTDYDYDVSGINQYIICNEKFYSKYFNNRYFRSNISIPCIVK